MATGNEQGQSSLDGVAADSLVASMSGFAILPVGESKRESSPPVLSLLVKGSDQFAENSEMSGNMLPSAREVTKDQNEAPIYVETTVEVCVKMVVCRKYVTNTIDSKTGKILSSLVKTEEDPPTILNVHTYKTSSDPTQSSSTTSAVGNHPSAANSASAPTPSIKRRPGRPRKQSPFVPLPYLKTLVKQSDSINEDVNSANRGAEEAGHFAMETDISPETGTSRDAAIVNTKFEYMSNKLIRQQTPEDVSLSKERQNQGLTSLPVKAKRGRPSRVIKKPRKYLDSYDEEFFKRESSGVPENDNNESDGEKESMDVEEKDDEEDEEEKKVNWVKKMEGEEEENGGEQRTECLKCGKKFSNVSNCQRHINKDQCNRQLRCPFCDKLFDSRDVLDSHMESHRDLQNQNSFRCSDCSRVYATRNGYLKHKRQGTCYKRDVFHEDGTQGEFECTTCRVRFTTEKLLELHKEKVHENPNNEYKCPDCSRVFYSKLGFNKHVAKKSCTQPHICKVCGKKYSNKAKESFKSHMRYHLAETSGVHFQCEDCGRVYMTEMALRKHRLTSHSNLRPYKCGTCSKTFPMRYMVRDHERSHTGEKPFLCSLCGTSFSNRGHLYRHMRSHTLGTLHKRGRPRKYPSVSRPVLLKLKDAGEEAPEGFEDLAGKEGQGGELGVVEIKTDPLQQQSVVQEDLGGPTYITVHTIDGQLGEAAAATQSIIGEGQLQHVVMETPDGMSDNMVLQVIRDLTGATTVYQHVTEQPLPSSSSSETVAAPPHQIIMSAVAQQGVNQPTLVVEPGSLDQPVVTAQQLMQSEGQQQQQQLIVAPSQTELIVAPSQTVTVTQALPT